MRGLAAARGDGTFLYPAETAWARWMGDLPRHDPAVARALTLLTPQPIRPFVEPVDLSVFYRLAVPRTYVRCLGDVAVPPAAAAGYAARLGVSPRRPEDRPQPHAVGARRARPAARDASRREGRDGTRSGLAGGDEALDDLAQALGVGAARRGRSERRCAAAGASGPRPRRRRWAGSSGGVSCSSTRAPSGTRGVGLDRAAGGRRCRAPCPALAAVLPVEGDGDAGRAMRSTSRRSRGTRT